MENNQGPTFPKFVELLATLFNNAGVDGKGDAVKAEKESIKNEIKRLDALKKEIENQKKDLEKMQSELKKEQDKIKEEKFKHSESKYQDEVKKLQERIKEYEGKKKEEEKLVKEQEKDQLKYQKEEDSAIKRLKFDDENRIVDEEETIPQGQTLQQGSVPVTRQSDFTGSVPTEVGPTATGVPAETGSYSATVPTLMQEVDTDVVGKLDNAINGAEAPDTEETYVQDEPEPEEHSHPNLPAPAPQDDEVFEEEEEEVYNDEDDDIVNKLDQAMDAENNSDEIPSDADENDIVDVDDVDSTDESNLESDIQDLEDKIQDMESKGADSEIIADLRSSLEKLKSNISGNETDDQEPIIDTGSEEDSDEGEESNDVVDKINKLFQKDEVEENVGDLVQARDLEQSKDDFNNALNVGIDANKYEGKNAGEEFTDREKDLHAEPTEDKTDIINTLDRYIDTIKDKVEKLRGLNEDAMGGPLADAPPADDEVEEDIPIEMEEKVKELKDMGFDLNFNNAYDFYDKIRKHLVDQESIDALNQEYESISDTRRHITPALFLYDKSIKTIKDKRKNLGKAAAGGMGDMMGGPGAGAPPLAGDGASVGDPGMGDFTGGGQAGGQAIV